MVNQVEEVKNKVDIVSLISEYIEVKKAGRNYKANCPFHGEKTASFMISPELQMYKCFGCGKHGDCFSFLEEHEGMEFGEALKYLADKVGIKLVQTKTNEVSEKEKIISINNDVFNFYKYALDKHPKSKKVLEYLTKDRGLTVESIKTFGIGYSPDDFNLLANFLLKKKKGNIQDFSKAGILVGRGIDRFRGRVIFTLYDHKGSVVGFAGRTLPWQDQKQAKYINSPDTPAYHKSKILYGLNITKQDVRNSGYVVVVEGELDLISTYNAGIKNVVAIKGSALTEDQIRLIGRFCNKIVLCLDSDSAGDEATKRGAILAVNLGFDVKVATVTGGKDPDEVARKDPEGLKKAIETAEDIWDFLITQVFKKYDIGTGSGKASISREISPLLGLIEDKIVKDHYIEKVARLLSVTPESVTFEVNKNIKQETVKESNIKTNPEVVNRPEKERIDLLEEKLLINILTNDPQQILDGEVFDLFRGQIITKVAFKLKEFLTENKKFDLNKFTNFLPKELSEYFSGLFLQNSETEDLNVLKREISIFNIKTKMKKTADELKKAENEQNATEAEKLQKQYLELTKKLSALE